MEIPSEIEKITHFKMFWKGSVGREGKDMRMEREKRRMEKRQTM